ncbi:Serine/threonine-protein kinase env7 [Kickxella alabastrina]|uniref:Serine/threonine-protein kinase env7 n=1 Tax=Kickxella alabastrina TaxID=61397 RepID=A0ACC1IVP4_9FUNG|nr:Serine/threonine-protein kinase env7 [Kickxella alabastrina]
MSLNSLYSILDDLTSTLCMRPLFAGQKSRQRLTINNTEYRIVDRLGEGGFSHVLLGETPQKTHYAIKKMVCHRGTDALAMARREIAAYGKFKHPNIIRMVDHSIIHDGGEDGERATVYMVFPLYRQGTLLDAVRHSQDTGRPLDEDALVRLFLGVCEAVRHMHEFGEEDAGAACHRGEEDAGAACHRGEEDAGAACHRGEEDAGTACHWGDAAAATACHRGEEDAGTACHWGDAAAATACHRGDAEPNNSSGYAHRDIKLANIMLSDDGTTPVLMDFGSVARARLTVRDRSEALRVQDDAAEQCSMPYRAPELFDVQRGCSLDERTDVWSLGCLLFALAWGHTPFEHPLAGGGGPGASIALAAINANYAVPRDSIYSGRIARLVAFMLEPDAAKRPFVRDVAELARKLYH